MCSAYWMCVPDQQACLLQQLCVLGSAVAQTWHQQVCGSYHFHVLRPATLWPCGPGGARASTHEDAGSGRSALAYLPPSVWALRQRQSARRTMWSPSGGLRPTLSADAKAAQPCVDSPYIAQPPKQSDWYSLFESPKYHPPVLQSPGVAHSHSCHRHCHCDSRGLAVVLLELFRRDAQNCTVPCNFP